MKLPKRKLVPVLNQALRHADLSLDLIKHHAIKYEGAELLLHAYLTSPLGGSEWPASAPTAEKDPGTHWTEGRVGPTAGLDAAAKKKTFIGIRYR
jgi:hypothetical protein